MVLLLVYIFRLFFSSLDVSLSFRDEISSTYEGWISSDLNFSPENPLLISCGRRSVEILSFYLKIATFGSNNLPELGVGPSLTLILMEL